MEYRHNASTTRPKDWKLMCDPFLNTRHAQKVYRCDGPTSGKSPERPRDPRDSRMNSWTSRREPADLPLPNFRYDEYYVGDPIEKEITFDNLNDNITRQNLLDMCKPFGVPEDAKVYFHPKTKKHLGIGKVVFRSSRAASECAQKLNNTSKMGNIMVVKVDTVGRERHALIQERISGVRRHPEVPPGLGNHAHGVPHGDMYGYHNHHQLNANQYPPQATQSHHVQNHPNHPSIAHPSHHNIPPHHNNSGPPFEESQSIPKREDPRLRLSAHHQSNTAPPQRSLGNHPPSSQHGSYWSSSRTPPNGVDPVPKESTPINRHSRSRHRHGRSRRSPREQISPGHQISDNANPHSATHLDAAARADGGEHIDFTDVCDRRDSSISNESGTTAVSASLLQDSLGALMSGSGQGTNEEESLESRIQNLLKGTSLSSGVALGGITPSPGPNSMPGSMFSAFVSGESGGHGATTPLSDEAMSDDNASADSGPVPMQPNTPPSPPSPADPSSQLSFPGIPMSSTPPNKLSFLPPPGLPLPQIPPNSNSVNRRTLLPTPQLAGGIALLPTPEARQLQMPYGISARYMEHHGSNESSLWPEACSDNALSEILQCLVDELKDVMKRDVSKRMIESCGFPAFHRWWNNQEKRVSGNLYPTSISPSKRHGPPAPNANTMSSPSFSKPTSLLGPGPTFNDRPPNSSNSFPLPPAPPTSESESGFGSSLGLIDGGESGTQTQSTAFAAIFESLKEGGGGFFSGIRSALPKIKRKPRPPEPLRTKEQNKNDSGKTGELKNSDKSKDSKTAIDQDDSELRKRSSSASSAVSSDDEAASPTTRRKRRVADADGSDSGTSPAVESDSEESESSESTAASSEESEEDEEDEEESEEEEEEEEERDAKVANEKAEKKNKKVDTTLSSSELSESDAERERVLLEKQQAELIYRSEGNQNRSKKPAAVRRKKATSKVSQKLIKENISSLSSSSSEEEPTEEPIIVKKKSTKKPTERKRDSSLFDVFNSLLEGKQKTSTTLATPETLNQRRLTEERESGSEKDEEGLFDDREYEKMDQGEDEMARKVTKKTKAQNRRPPPKAKGKPATNRKQVPKHVEEEHVSVKSLSSDSESEEEEDDDDEEDDDEDEDDVSASGSAMSQDEDTKDEFDSVSDFNDGLDYRRRRKQDLYSPHTSLTPSKSSPIKSLPSTPCESSSAPRAQSASERLKQLKRGEMLSPLPPLPIDTPSSGGHQSSFADDEKDISNLEDLDWLPEIGVSYEWPWEIQHDHSYCFEPNRDAMEINPPTKPAVELMELIDRQQTLKRKQPDKRRGAPAAKKQRSMQDITNRHRDRSNRGSRELASLFTPVEVKALDRARQREESQSYERRRDRARMKSKRRQQRMVFKQRDNAAEQNILYDIFLHGIDAEDVKLLQLCYQKLLDQDNTGCSWLNDTHWVDHPATYCPSDTSQETKQGKTRSKAPLSPEIPVHKTGSARTEGFYKLSRTQKYSALMAARNSCAELLGPRGGDFPTNVNAGNTATGTIGMEEISSKKSKLREMRSEQRRLLAEFQDVETGDLLKFNQLKFRKKQLQFGRSGIHSWGLFALETIAAEEMVIEYVGQMVRKHVAEVREKKYEACGKCSSYLFRVDDEYVIDATMCGNFARFINHSCNPNCYAKVVTMEGAKKMVIYSRREILKFEEITYDYKFPYEEEKIPCLCGSSMCRGTLN